MQVLLGLILLGLAGFSLPAMASQWTDSEIKGMPPYCAARLHKDPARDDEWRNALGPDYLHTHHYCYAIGFIGRYYGARTDRSKAFNLQSALGNLNYMVSNASPTYRLMPEVYLNRGLVYSLQKKDGAAIADMHKAIELDPRLTRAYSMAADYYVKLNKKDTALKLVTDGVRHNPDSTVLQRLYVKLGGRLPYPEPVAQQEQIPEPPASQENAAQQDKLPGNASGPEMPPPALPAADAASTAERAAGDAPAAPNLGSPSNPWCRFCPPEPER